MDMKLEACTSPADVLQTCQGTGGLAALTAGESATAHCACHGVTERGA
jgi:hypothetical protein